MIRRGRDDGDRTGTVSLPWSALCRRRRGMMSLSRCEVSRGGRGLCHGPGPRYAEDDGAMSLSRCEVSRGGRECATAQVRAASTVRPRFAP